MRVPVTAAIAFMAFAAPVPAEEGAGGVYKCTAESGAVTYSTSPCKGAKREFLSREKLEGKLSIIEFPKPVSATPEPSTASAKTPEGSATAATSAPQATPATPAVANPKIRTSPIKRKLGKD